MTTSDSSQSRKQPLNCDRDAARWADEFNDVLAKQYNIRVDEGLLIGWFANAMMCGEDTYRWRQEANQSENVLNPEQRHSGHVAESPSPRQEPGEAGVATGRAPVVPESNRSAEGTLIPKGMPPLELSIAESASMLASYIVKNMDVPEADRTDNAEYLAMMLEESWRQRAARSASTPSAEGGTVKCTSGHDNNPDNGTCWRHDCGAPVGLRSAKVETSRIRVGTFFHDKRRPQVWFDGQPMFALEDMDDPLAEIQVKQFGEYLLSIGVATDRGNANG